MRKSILIRGGIGFVLGMAIGAAIPLLSQISSGGPIQLYSDVVLARTGNPTSAIVMQLFFSGLYGMLTMGGTVAYDVEQWSLLRATVTHYLLCFVPYPMLGWLLGWFATVSEHLIILGIMTGIFFLIWLILYLNYRREVRKLNEMQRKINATAEHKRNREDASD